MRKILSSAPEQKLKWRRAPFFLLSAEPIRPARVGSQPATIDAFHPHGGIRCDAHWPPREPAMPLDNRKRLAWCTQSLPDLVDRDSNPLQINDHVSVTFTFAPTAIIGMKHFSQTGISPGGISPDQTSRSVLHPIHRAITTASTARRFLAAASLRLRPMEHQNGISSSRSSNPCFFPPDDALFSGFFSFAGLRSGRSSSSLLPRPPISVRRSQTISVE